MKTSKDKKYKLIIYLNWGLANRLFQIASAMGFAEKWNMDLYISPKYINNNDHLPFEESIKDIKQLFPTLHVLPANYDTSQFKKIEIINRLYLKTNNYNTYSSLRHIK
jgi:hypothetical protein